MKTFLVRYKDEHGVEKKKTVEADSYRDHPATLFYPRLVQFVIGKYVLSSEDTWRVLDIKQL